MTVSREAGCSDEQLWFNITALISVFNALPAQHQTYTLTQAGGHRGTCGAVGGD